MNLKTSDKLQKAFEVFLKTYDNRVKITNVDTIIGGEQLELNENNILVNNTTFEDPKFEDKCKLCTKKLYNYQKKFNFLSISFTQHEKGTLHTARHIDALS